MRPSLTRGVLRFAANSSPIGDNPVSMPPPPPPPSSPPPPPPPPYGGGIPPGYVPYTQSGPTQPLASAGMRILARFLDGVIQAIVMLLAALALVSSGESIGFGGYSSKGVTNGKLFLFLVISFGLSFVYEAVITAKAGGTPMKLAFGLRVVDAATGSPVGMQQSVIRWAVPGLAGIIPRIGRFISSICSIVSLVLLFTDQRHQTISDKAAKTLVVKKA